MTSIQRTLLVIAIFLTLAIGSFIWFVANWDADAPTTFGAVSKTPMHTASIFSDLKKSWGLGQSPSPALNSGGTST